MKKVTCCLALLSITFAPSLSLPKVFSQTEDFGRLYGEFLKELETDTTQVTPPIKSLGKQVELTGTIVKDGDKFLLKVGKEFYRLLTTNNNLSKMIVAISGNDAKNQVVVKGTPYLAGGIMVAKPGQKFAVVSVNHVQDLTGSATKDKKGVQDPVVRVKTWCGTIVLDKGNPYLKVKKGAYRLLNEKEWKRAFLFAYKGQVCVEGVKSGDYAIRYSSINEQ